MSIPIKLNFLPTYTVRRLGTYDNLALNQA